MSVFFKGRVWNTPTTMSAVNDAAMYNPQISTGNVPAFLGSSEGGEPAAELRFTNAAQARDALRSGPLLTAIELALDASAESAGPAEVVAVRTDPATQSSLSLADSLAADVIDLTSTDYGLYTNQIRVKVEAGTTTGLKLSTQLGTALYTEDDVARNAFSVVYAGGEATATMTITGDTVTLYAPAATPVAVIDLNTYTTMQQLVDRINTTDGFTGAVLDGNEDTATLNGLDYVTAQDVLSATYTALANLQAAVDWFNSVGEGFVTAARVAAVGTVPAAVDWTYLTGAVTGTVTNTEWQAAFDVLQTSDVNWIVPLSSSASIHAMADTHAAYMSGIGRSERRAICGTASGTTDAAAIAAAKLLNSDRTSLTHLGIYGYDSTGALALFEPFYAAAMIAGAFAGLPPGEAMTNKGLKIRGIERNLRNPTDTDLLIKGGVLAIGSDFKVIKSISTWLTNTNFNRVEVSTGAALDFVSRTVRTAVDVVRGQKGSPQTLALALSNAETALKQLAVPAPQGPGVIVGDEASPAYKNLTVSLEGDVLRVDFQCSPAIPVNFVPVTIYAVPYSGTATQ